MAEKIATYKASNLELRPSNVGTEAHEQAGRRIGPFAEQAAHAVEQVAQLSAKVTEEAGQQQTAFARFEGLEDKGAGAAVKYGGGLKDMFQLGAGGNEPNYARLNRMAELQDGTLSIANAARHIVRAQSPLTQDLMPNDAWQLNTDAKKGGIAPNAEPSDEDFQKQIQKDWTQDNSGDPWSPDQFGPSMVERNSKGMAVGGNVGGTGGDWNPQTGSFNPVSGATNPAEPPGWSNPPADETNPAPPPTNSTVWPTTPSQQAPDQPVTPDASPTAPPFWSDLSGGM